MTFLCWLNLFNQLIKLFKNISGLFWALLSLTISLFVKLDRSSAISSTDFTFFCGLFRFFLFFIVVDSVLFSFSVYVVVAVAFTDSPAVLLYISWTRTVLFSISEAVVLVPAVFCRFALLLTGRPADCCCRLLAVVFLLSRLLKPLPASPSGWVSDWGPNSTRIWASAFLPSRKPTPNLLSEPGQI